MSTNIVMLTSHLADISPTRQRTTRRSSKNFAGLYVAYQAADGSARRTVAWVGRLRRSGQSALATKRSPRGPHPADILYWLTCIGAASLLIFAAT